MFICSPYQRCLKTAELIICGMVQRWTQVKANTIFVEDALAEIQSVKYAKKIENLDTLEMTQKKIIDFPIIRNSLEFLSRYHNKMNFNFPEDKFMMT